MKLRRVIALAMACLLLCGSAVGEEGSVYQDDHFSPENPADMPVDDRDQAAAALQALVYPDAGEDWYQELLVRAQMRLGNNQRLLKLIRRAQAGEKITVATIGGSITEGAGARRYTECYAYRFYSAFKALYGAGDGNNVGFVNAGVGGTASTFGLMRFQREVTDRVKDDDGYADLVVIEFAVNDGGEPTGHQCYESMVKSILAQPNDPVVILLFAVFDGGYNLQHELRRIGDTYQLMMVSIKDGAYPLVGQKWTTEEFFHDTYHPTSMGHGVMSDCLISAVQAAAAQPPAEEDLSLDVPPAYGDSYVGLQRIFAEADNSAWQLERGSFLHDDRGAYSNTPVGRVCGQNFFHAANDGNEPLRFTASFRNLLIAYRSTGDKNYGQVEVYMDGMYVRTLNGCANGAWGQSVVDLLFSYKTAKEHTVEIRMKKGDENKKFTITCIAFTP